MRHYDIGIFGWWYNGNYGAIISYFALNRVLTKLGYSVVMLWRSSNTSTIPESIPCRFGSKYYEMSERYTSKTMLSHYNDLCDKFVLGSDQLWNPDLEGVAGAEFFLDFAETSKTKVAYAQSFGNERRIPDSFRYDYYKLIFQFQDISFREDYASKMCFEAFGISAPQVCDPVFLLEKKDYFELIDNSDIALHENYIVNFLLDPTPEKLDICKYIREDKKIDTYINFTDLDRGKDKAGLFQGEHVEAETKPENLLKAYANADFIITDSYHGTCLAILFNKQFICIGNKERGMGRFLSLLKWLNLEEYLVTDYDNLRSSYITPIDYNHVNKIIKRTREESLTWLRRALNKSSSYEQTKQINCESLKKLVKKVENLYSNSDYRKIRILVTLLRDYGIKHIVLSPGGRDVPLVRMIENNRTSFVLHRVTDERSAAYYGLGIATRLQQPVACVCTSGTAASNYLPAVTEAFYTGVPLILITADRREIFLNHGEDQTIPQKNIYRDVTKKEITVPEAEGNIAEYQTRRDISDCILESVHNGFGPVHINISIDDIFIGSTVDRRLWRLLPFISPHILRVTSSDPEEKRLEWVNSLKRSNRILVVYGQNSPPNERQLKNINSFCEKYNCVIVTDFISNFNNSYSVMSYNMIRNMTQQEFNKYLSPDILVTVGGKRLMNDPLTFKIRGGLRSIRHWSVTADGIIKDFYFHLTSVLEMTQDYFFEWFASHAGDAKNNMIYVNEWKGYAEKVQISIKNVFNAHYVQSKFFRALPANSFLHLGVGQAFVDSRQFELDSSIETYCNMGTNGIDGGVSTFMGQCSMINNRLCFLLVGDLSFFYDMNGIWNKPLTGNVRILLVNNYGTSLLRIHNLEAITSAHQANAKGWVETVGFEYMSAHNKEEFEKKLPTFVEQHSDRAIFFEVFCA